MGCKLWDTDHQIDGGVEGAKKFLNLLWWVLQIVVNGDYEFILSMANPTEQSSVLTDVLLKLEASDNLVLS